MENNKMTELELKIDKWLENEQFVAFSFYSNNQYAVDVGKHVTKM